MINQDKSENSLVQGSWNVEENISDLQAQVAANQRGISLMKSLIDEYSLLYVQAYMRFIMNNAEETVWNMLVRLSVWNNLKDIDTVVAEDYMDDGTSINLKLTLNWIEKTANFDFTGSGFEVLGNTNAPKAITYSAIIYCLWCLVDSDIPLNQGCLNPIQV